MRNIGITVAERAVNITRPVEKNIDVIYNFNGKAMIYMMTFNFKTIFILLSTKKTATKLLKLRETAIDNHKILNK